MMGIAYKLAKEFGFTTVGIAPEHLVKTFELFPVDFELFPVDEAHIVGETFGDESEFFLASVNRLICLGGGPQCRKEVAMAREMQHITAANIAEYDVDVNVQVQPKSKFVVYLLSY